MRYFRAAYNLKEIRGGKIKAVKKNGIILLVLVGGEISNDGPAINQYL